MLDDYSAICRSLYVHVPFCQRKCPYCAFASAPATEGDEEIYLDSLAKELAERARLAPRLDTFYAGGGTPSVLSPGAWEKLIAILEKYFTFAPGAEVTVEANPGSLEKKHLRIWKDWRVTRISLGVQSFDDARLAFLGRVHTADEARMAVDWSAEADLGVSVDMMFGLPGETLRDWGLDLRRAIETNARHISVYQLTIEDGTPFAEMGFDTPEGYAQYRYAQWRLPRAGYEQYEVASFAAPGHESRHNLNYWDDGEYLGAGPAAWSYIGGTRSRNAPELAEYAKAVRGHTGAVFSERLGAEASARTAAVLALRTRRGVVWKNFARRHGEEIAREIKKILGGFPPDLVENGEEASRLSAKGIRAGNAIWSEII